METFIENHLGKNIGPKIVIFYSMEKNGQIAIFCANIGRGTFRIGRHGKKYYTYFRYICPGDKLFQAIGLKLDYKTILSLW